jgi:hypothetical protein
VQSDRRLADLDASSQAALAAGTATAADVERAYAKVVGERRAVLTSALDYLFPVANHLPSGSILKMDSPIISAGAAKLGMYAPAEFKKRIADGIYLAEPFDPSRDVILAVHGINGLPSDWNGFIPAMDRARFQVWMAYYPTGEKIPEMAELLRTALAAELAKHPARRVYVVCHSLGGLVVRTMLAHGGFPGPLASVAFASTPHRGVRYAPMSIVRPACRWLWRFLPAEVDDLLEGSKYLADLNAAPVAPYRYRTAGGNAWHTPKAHVVGPFIPGDDDGLVPTGNTSLAGSLDHRVFPEDHYTIVSSPEFVAAFKGWLDQDAAANPRAR